MKKICTHLISNLQDLINLKRITTLNIIVLEQSFTEFECRKWDFVDQFIKTESACFDMHLMTKYEIESSVLRLYFMPIPIA